ncbi:MAG: hypothetical protein A2166_00425 [Omnitrophica WOR_2 bacterium RBG_13_41_10]|nr:MAG: hypothetical protein A2166_00425 [Omnitrophica WOR_2 bacterium RBG_13_41_10]
MSKKIFHIIRGFNYGGINEFLYTFIKYSKSNTLLKHYVIAFKDGSFRSRFEELNCPIFFTEDRGVTDLVKRNGGDCVVTHIVNGSPSYLHQHVYDLFLSHIPVINYAHCSFPLRSPAWLFKQIITTSKSNVLILGLDKVIRIPIPIDIERYKVKSNILEIKKKWKVPLDRVILGRISRIESLKMISETIMAYIELRRKTKIPIFLLLAGEEATYGLPKGVRIQEMKKLVSSLGLTDNDFLYVGPVSDEEKQEILSIIDIYSAPTSMEGYGIVFCEASLFGKPIVSYDNYANKEVIAEGGIVVKDKDSNALVEALKTLVEDSELRRKIGKQGELLVKRRNNPDSIVKQIEDAIFNAISYNDKSSFYQYRWEARKIKIIMLSIKNFRYYKIKIEIKLYNLLSFLKSIIKTKILDKT